MNILNNKKSRKAVLILALIIGVIVLSFTILSISYGENNYKSLEENLELEMKKSEENKEE